MGRIWQRGKNGRNSKVELIPAAETAKDEGHRHTRRAPDVPYIAGSDPNAEQFIIVPKNNVNVFYLLRSLGAETVTSVSRSDSQEFGDDHLVLTLPDSLTVTSGRFAHEGEFKCNDQLGRPGIVPEIIKSADGHVVAGLFYTFKGDFQVIGPTWAGIAKRLNDTSHHLLPKEVVDVKIEDLTATEQGRKQLEEMGIKIDPDLVFPEGSNWERLLIGVTDLANYPIGHHCKSELARSLGLAGSSTEATKAFDALLESAGHFYSAISFGRGQRYQTHVAIESTPNQQPATLDR